ncbi:MAG: type VI secretion system-associated protein TagF [Pseudomonadota bacterium]
MIALFGKVPARRDFVARDLPSSVLEPLERWLQHGVAQSRDTLGNAWMDAYLAAPLWRFWWGREVIGTGLTGVMMPSVDAMGRYFPLLALRLAHRGCDITLPSEATADWYDAVETALLGALDQTKTLSSLLDDLSAIPDQLDATPLDVTGTLWWTLGGERHPPRRMAHDHLPPHTAFTDMLTAPATQS